MNANTGLLVNDEYTGEPAKRVLNYVQSKREAGKHVIGLYCGYAPLEVIRAMDAVPAVLCAFAHKTIEAAEVALPANLCPLIKSSYGFILTDTCPFYGISEAVIAETTCDGKKKMFEMIADLQPLFVMDLPQLPERDVAHRNWTIMIRELQSFLERTFDTKISDDAIEAEIKDSNAKNRMMQKIFSYAARSPSIINWRDIYDLTFLGMSARGSDLSVLFQDVVDKLEKRIKNKVFIAAEDAPRVLVTGCPIGGDATKVFRIIEEAGGVIVALDACTGMKAFAGEIEEDTADPVAAIARRYLEIPCSCMSPNERRLIELDAIISQYRPDAVIDVILHTCHSYNVESYKVGRHVKEKHCIPFLKIETDYSEGDVEQIRTRVEALFESCR